MEKIKKSQIAEIVIVAALLLSSASLKSGNLIYLVVNIIIITVAAEAGLFSFFQLLPAAVFQSGATHREDPNPPSAASVVLQLQKPMILSGDEEKMDGIFHYQSAMATQVVENRSLDKFFGAVHEAPSIFFIAGGESDTNVEDDGEEVGEVISRQELFQKAEIFIGNFYKQLNIQREESWNNLQQIIVN